MSFEILGGNKLQTLDLQKPGTHSLAEGPYSYTLWTAHMDDTLSITALGSYTVFVRSLEGQGTCFASLPQKTDSRHPLHRGDAIQSENQPLTLHCKTDRAEFLIAGVPRSAATDPVFRVTTNAAIKKVQKPWGHELWINGEHPGYAFKEIFIKAGTKTSLQYHRLKQETNVLFEGHSKLHYKFNPTCPNDAVTPADLKTQALHPGASVDVPPTTIHRLEAVTDVLLYEISTPHLDDVIRISDDAGRPNGRIQTEHGV